LMVAVIKKKPVKAKIVTSANVAIGSFSPVITPPWW
jgi:hypothetical protein